MDEKKDTITRARAEKLIARTTDPKVLETDLFTKHVNKHVRAKAQFKLKRLV